MNVEVIPALATRVLARPVELERRLDCGRHTHESRHRICEYHTQIHVHSTISPDINPEQGETCTSNVAWWSLDVVRLVRDTNRQEPRTQKS
jgi:hypothetical protein